MFAEVKATLPVSGDGYDEEIIMQIKAAALDLTRTTEIVLPGEISITREKNALDSGYTITDNSTVTDALIITAIAVWCQMRIGNPPNYDNLQKAYDSLKGSLRLSREYTTAEAVTTE